MEFWVLVCIFNANGFIWDDCETEAGFMLVFVISAFNFRKSLLDHLGPRVEDRAFNSNTRSTLKDEKNRECP